MEAIMSESGYYPPGAENDPRAPWNQVDPTESDEFQAMRERMVMERADDINGWFRESLSEASEGTLKRLSTLFKEMYEADDFSAEKRAEIGTIVYVMLEIGCTPPEDEILEALELDENV
jgi:hypothetical protein